jgi:hypothetical protein
MARPDSATAVDTSRDGSPLRATERHDSERLRAAGAFICGDAGRARAAVSLLRTYEAEPVESEVHGTSMGSVLPHAAHIRIALGSDACDVGQVIAFMAGGKVFVHRVVYRGRFGIARNHLITQGDAMRLPDPPIAEADVLGPVVEVQCGTAWRPPDPAARAARRDRLLAFAVLAIGITCLHVSPRLAVWLIDRLGVADRRLGWTRALLY